MYSAPLLILLAVAVSTPPDQAQAQTEETMKPPAMTKAAPELTPLQKKVIMENGTEPAFRNEYWDNKEVGIYVDRLSGEPLFSSGDKFDSGTGWPSFTKPIKDQSMHTESDESLGVQRTAVTSASGAHLGHVFDDGPKDKGGQRYCINSASLRFVPKAKMKEEGYGQYLYLFPHGGGETK
jgi:methionine-R-sulfoxide reductase